MKTAAYFISSHGYGHGVRSCRVINSLAEKFRIVIFSSLPEKFFNEELNSEYIHIPCELDCGCVQKNAVDIDISATLKKYSVLNRSRDKIIKQIGRTLKNYKAEFVLADIPPLAFAAAKKAGIPGFGISNFNWVDIYEPYLMKYTEYSSMLKQMKQDYSLCDKYFSLYPGLDGNGFRNIEKTGMVVRKGIRMRKVLAEKFNMDINKKWCLIYLGGAGLDTVKWNNLRNFADWEFWGLYPLPGASSNYHFVTSSTISYADFTASSDLVLGKLGYGLVTESLAHGVPVLFVGREDFAEYHVFKDKLINREQGAEIDLSELVELNIRSEMENLSNVNLIGWRQMGSI